MSAAGFVPASRSLRVLGEAVHGCRGCPLFRNATQAVFGAGRSRAAIMLVGEQPGDREDRLPDGRGLLVTPHPSSLLRIPDRERRRVEFARFVADLALVGRSD